MAACANLGELSLLPLVCLCSMAVPPWSTKAGVAVTAPVQADIKVPRCTVLDPIEDDGSLTGAYGCLTEESEVGFIQTGFDLQWERCECVMCRVSARHFAEIWHDVVDGYPLADGAPNSKCDCIICARFKVALVAPALARLQHELSGAGQDPLSLVCQFPGGSASTAGECLNFPML